MIISQLSDIVCTIMIMSLSGSTLILLLFALKPLIRHRLPKSIQYFLWLVTLAALLVPVSKLIAIPEAPSNIILAPIHTVVEQNNVIVEEEANTLPQTNTNTDPQTDTTDMPAVKPAMNPVLTATTVFVMTYMLIVLVVLSYNILSYIRFTKKVRRHRTRARMDELYKHVGLCGDAIAPRLYRSALATTPMLIGIFKPEIILPDREYTETQIQYILKHELIHLRRRDVIFKWLSAFACALHWFNPLVWLGRREIDRVCELSCDEAMIRNLDQAGKRSYGETLISVAAVNKAPRTVLSTTMCEEKEALKERLDVIMKYQKRTWVALVFSTVMILLALCAVCLLGAGAVPLSASGNYNADALESTPMQSVLLSATPAATSTPSPSGQVIVFEDPAVEKVIRATLRKPEGPVTDQDMLEVTTFKPDHTYAGKIKTLDDLRWCVNLSQIVLWETNITDISVLYSLQNLMGFQCQDKLNDYTPLLAHKNLRKIQMTGVTDSFFRELMANCKNLKVVYLHKSDISSESIQMLAENYNLSILSMTECGISDVSPFVGFTGLEYFSLESNNVTDISPLAENPQLCRWEIDLSDNKITDWSPLENMTAMALCVGRNPVTESPALDKIARKGCTIHM